MRKLEHDKTNILFNDNNIHTNTDKHNEHNFHNRTQISYWLIKKAVWVLHNIECNCKKGMH